MLHQDLLGNGGRAALKACVKVKIHGEPELHQFSKIEGQNQVFDCFMKPISITDFPRVLFADNLSTVTIRDIKSAVDKLLLIPVLQNRAKQENINALNIAFNNAIQPIDIEHGTGFIIADGFVITNAHVTERVDNHNYCAIVLNGVIDDIRCTIVHTDPAKDLSLLYSPNLQLSTLGIMPLPLSTEPMLPGQAVMVFGFPFTHNGTMALFTQGYVSGSREQYGKPSLTILNCPLNHGNSGGPVMQRSDGKLRVTGVASQKHSKEILELEEKLAIEHIRESLQTTSISSSAPSHPLFRTPASTQNMLAHLTLKLYDSLTTHSQFNLSNAVNGETLIEFIRSAIQAQCCAQVNTLNMILPQTRTRIASLSTSTTQSSTSRSIFSDQRNRDRRHPATSNKHYRKQQ